MDHVLQLGALAGALTAIVTAVYLGGRWMLRTLRRIDDWLDDWYGEPARPGQPARPGVPERLTQIEARQAAIEAQLRPNGGGSLRDAVDRVEQTVRGE
ncbi:hypothetical protein E1193_13510 [Micromonospora sp. KC606]|uniref:hypothetical protein n=1 Tax=Micromonospora sp. KC606 TaxID=2530379 RepID=UPI001050A071|nr:hypothetical protein [Micromonospora sp. KC606]TDC81914.1 hypothetical protein E1193_13510 [Micromonospora sp. KC606]